MSDIRAPSLGLLLAEPGRAALELGLLGSSLPLLLATTPRGDGHPVMVLPGLGAKDHSTLPLRQFLCSKGYAPYGWGHGRNRGLEGPMRPLVSRIARLSRDHGRRVSLVGWSLGGIYARELAKLAPELVRCVITLGTPFRGPQEASNAQWIYQMLSGRSVNEHPPDHFSATPPVPTTAIFTRGDGIVAWQRCMESPADQIENIRVCGSHCGLGFNPSVIYVVADRLAQAEGAWRHFAPRGPARPFYRA